MINLLIGVGILIMTLTAMIFVYWFCNIKR